MAIPFTDTVDEVEGQRWGLGNVNNDLIYGQNFAKHYYSMLIPHETHHERPGLALLFIHLYVDSSVSICYCPTNTMNI